MIQRIRDPYGRKADIDLGGGPLGDADIQAIYQSRWMFGIAGVMVSQADVVKVENLSIVSQQRNLRRKARATA